MNIIQGINARNVIFNAYTTVVFLYPPPDLPTHGQMIHLSPSSSPTPSPSPQSTPPTHPSTASYIIYPQTTKSNQ